jgi:hypothetical protein
VPLQSHTAPAFMPVLPNARKSATESGHELGIVRYIDRGAESVRQHVAQGRDPHPADEGSGATCSRSVTGLNVASIR